MFFAFTTQLVTYGIIGVIGIIVGIIAWVLRKIRDQKVQKELEAYGLEQVNPAHDEFLGRLKSFGYLTRGLKNKFVKVFRGNAAEWNIILFDFDYLEEGARKGDEKWKSTTVLGANSEELDFTGVNEKKASGLNIFGKDSDVIFYTPGKLLNASEYDSFIKNCLKALVRMQKKAEENEE